MKADSEDAGETVILLHGLWMRDIVMLAHQRWLCGAGFAVRRFSYPSRRAGLDDNARRLARCVRQTPGRVIHLVAHSLGGLVALQMLAHDADPRIGRVVLMGTPYAGCHCGATLAAWPLCSGLIGRTFDDWFKQPRPELPARIQIGVLAGTRRLSFGRLIPGLARPNDGLVAVAETRLASAADAIALPVSHSGMLVARACAAQVVSFLRTGAFARA